MGISKKLLLQQTQIVYFQSDDVSDCDHGFDQSLQHVLKAIEEQGPFDGLMGFSQGAALASLLCLMQKEPQFKFAMFFAPFMSCCSKVI